MNITKEQAIELAKEANATPYTNRHFLDRPFFTFSPEQLEALCNLAVAHAAKDVEPVHTDHPMRHYDRTCPACQAGMEPQPPNHPAHDDTALLRQCLKALKYHMAQTRPIYETTTAITALRERLGELK